MLFYARETFRSQLSMTRSHTTTTLASAPVSPSGESAVDNLLQSDVSNKDCLGCRLIGSSAFIALGGYTFFSGRQQLREAALQETMVKTGTKINFAARRAGIHGLSATLIGLGLYRLLM